MAKGKKAPVSIAPKLVALLKQLSAEDRPRAIRAALLLVGEGGSESLDLGQGGDGGSGFPVGTEGGRGRVGKAQEFFAKKLPRTKLEELAVAARYREDRDGTTSSSKAELEAIFKEARKNFDSKHYRRDLENAKQAGLFTRAPAKEGASLSDYGLKYVDALPDREAAKALVRPKKGKARGKKKRT